MRAGLGRRKAGVEVVEMKKRGGGGAACAPALGLRLGKRNENRIRNTKQHPVNPPPTTTTATTPPRPPPHPRSVFLLVSVESGKEMNQSEWTLCEEGEEGEGYFLLAGLCSSTYKSSQTSRSFIFFI